MKRAARGFESLLHLVDGGKNDSLAALMSLRLVDETDQMGKGSGQS